jgi:hypothetical protein
MPRGDPVPLMIAAAVASMSGRTPTTRRFAREADVLLLPQPPPTLTVTGAPECALLRPPATDRRLAMTELETTLELEAEDFSDDLGDEALDRAAAASGTASGCGSVCAGS